MSKRAKTEKNKIKSLSKRIIEKRRRGSPNFKTKIKRKNYQILLPTYQFFSDRALNSVVRTARSTAKYTRYFAN